MSNHKNYGIVDGIAQGEPGSIEGNLAIAAVLADSVHSPESIIVVGSTASSAVDLAQLCLTAEQAIKLGALLSAAGADALEADREQEMRRMHGPAAVRLCLALSEAGAHEVLVDQSRIRLGYTRVAQDLAERAYETVASTTAADGDWRRVWREAGELLRKATP